MMQHTLTRSIPPEPASHRHYAPMARVIRYLQTQRAEQPDLDTLAAVAHMSPAHLQRTFKSWVGLSPKQFLQVLNKQAAKQRLRTHTVDHTAMSMGLSGSSRLHDLMVQYEAVTPGEFRQAGDKLRIYTQEGWCRFGYYFAAATSRGVLTLHFVNDGDDAKAHAHELKEEWPAATFLQEANAHLSALREALGGTPCLEADYSPTRSSELADTGAANTTTTPVENHADIVETTETAATTIKLLLHGSPFQVKVWEALMAIPHGVLCSYQQIAESIHHPTAVRAVASAIARNHIAYFIPCHRVIRASGEFHHYRWGAERKQALIAWESTA